MNSNFNKLYQQLLVEADFSKVSTHNFDQKLSVKDIQNRFFLEKVPARSSQELVLGFVGNPAGLESHVEEYRALGFTSPGQIIIFERQPAAAAALVEKAIELGYKKSKTNPQINSTDFYKEIKIINDSLYLDLKTVPLVRELIPHITHIDYDGVEWLDSAQKVKDSIQTVFSYPSIKTLTLVYTRSRALGGTATATTTEVTRETQETLQQLYTYNPNVYGVGVEDLNWKISKKIEKPLDYFIELAARNHLQKSKTTSLTTLSSTLRGYIKSIITNSRTGTTISNAIYQDISTEIQAIGNVSAKIIPYTGLSNMISIPVVRDVTASVEVDLSLLPAKSSYVNHFYDYLVRYWPLNKLRVKGSKMSLAKYLKTQYPTQDVSAKN